MSGLEELRAQAREADRMAARSATADRRALARMLSNVIRREMERLESKAGADWKTPAARA